MKRKLMLLSMIVALTTLVVTQGAAAFADATGTTTINGEVATATVSITPPSAVTLPRFTIGDVTGSSVTPGVVSVAPGTAGYPVAYAVTASDANEAAGRGFMMNGTTQLSSTNKFFISANETDYYPADEGFTYTGISTGSSPIQLPFFVKQRIDGDEAPGTYSITVKLTAVMP